MFGACARLTWCSPNDLFPGLEIKLMKHQIIGTSWYAVTKLRAGALRTLDRRMLKQEFDPVNHGGILACVTFDPTEDLQQMMLTI
jgi:hypothetical protein